MSSSETDKKDVGTSHSEWDEELQEPDEEKIEDRKIEQKPDEENELDQDEANEGEQQSSGSSANDASARQGVVTDYTMFGRQSNDVIINQVQKICSREVVNNLLTKVESDFRDLCLDEAKLRRGAVMYLDRVIDFITLGLVFSVYRDIKMVAYSATVVRMDQMVEEKNKVRTDIFGKYYDTESKCVCTKCTKMIVASRFARHLEGCMNIVRSRTRNASRAAVTATSISEKKSSLCESMPSSEEDNDDGDADWSSGGYKHKKKRDRNGTKKFKGMRTKKPELASSRLMELEEVDIEGVVLPEDQSHV